MAERTTDWNIGAWGMFLQARAELIAEARAEGKSWDDIARWLSCDPGQVEMIWMGRDLASDAEEYEAQQRGETVTERRFVLRRTFGRKGRRRG